MGTFSKDGALVGRVLGILVGAEGVITEVGGDGNDIVGEAGTS